MPAQVVARTVDPNTGLRSYSASAYFDANARARDNLHVVTNAVVGKILFDGRRAKAVEFQSDGKIYAVAVTNEVVLAAGKTAFDSLKVLRVREAMRCRITRDSSDPRVIRHQEQDASGEPFWICLRLDRTCKIIP